MFRLGGRGGLPLAVRFRGGCAESIQYSLHRCSTLTEGRNRLLEVALERYAANDAAGPLYYIYLDGDVRLEEVKDFGKQCERLVRFERGRTGDGCFDMQAETPAMRGVHLKLTSRSGNLQ